MTQLADRRTNTHRSTLLPLCALLAGAVACGDAADNGERARNDPAPTGGDPLENGPEGSGGESSDFGNPDDDGTGQEPMLQPTGGLSADTCARAQVSVERIRPRVVFLVDSSSSMSEDFGGPTRWDALRASLLADDGVVPTLHELVKFGLVTFAGPRYTACPSYRYAAPAPENLTFVDSAFPDVPPDESSTPTGAAMDWAIDNAFLDQVPGPDVRLEEQYMIFATDGEPNGCAGAADGEPARDFDSVIAAAHKAAARGIKIFVVSLADASGEFADHLAQIAEIGQTDRVYSPQTRADLVSELETIVGAAISCEVELQGAVYEAMACAGEVTLDGVPLTCNGDDGWELVDPTHIRFKGQACRDFRLTPSAFAEATFPCEALQ